MTAPGHGIGTGTGQKIKKKQKYSTKNQFKNTAALHPAAPTSWPRKPLIFRDFSEITRQGPRTKQTVYLSRKGAAPRFAHKVIHRRTPFRSPCRQASAIIPLVHESIKKETFVLSVLQAAGWPIWPLILCSVLVLAVIIERLIQLQTSKVIPPRLLAQTLETTQQASAHPQQIEQLERAGALGPVLASGLKVLQAHPTATDEEVRNSMEIVGRIAAQNLERYLSLLGTLASAAPLLGLLGTVVGMIEIFGAHQANANQPAQLAHGISVALYNTAFGLVIAIPALLFWRYFRARVDRHLLAMEVAADRFAHHLAKLRR